MAKYLVIPIIFLIGCGSCNCKKEIEQIYDSYIKEINYIKGYTIQLDKEIKANNKNIIGLEEKMEPQELIELIPCHENK